MKLKISGTKARRIIENFKAEFSILVEFTANGLLNYFISYNLYGFKGGKVSKISFDSQRSNN